MKNKTVLVTGSTRGIGLAIARRFHREGCNVIVTGRSSETFAALKKSFANNALFFECDFTDPMKVGKLADQIAQAKLSIDILICNVGSGKSVPDEVPEHAEFEALMGLNFYAATIPTRVFLPQIEKNKGSILLVSSIAGVEAIGAPIAYASAKAALNAFAKSLAKRMGGRGVRVNVVAPGNILFEGGSWEKKYLADKSGVDQYIQTHVPMRRFGTPEEVAETALFLCSEKAGFVTGSTVIVDGGQTHILA